MVLFIICLVLFAFIGAFAIFKGYSNSNPAVMGTGGVMLFLILVCILGLLLHTGVILV